jgi:hypothetical protein
MSSTNHRVVFASFSRLMLFWQHGRACTYLHDPFGARRGGQLKRGLLRKIIGDAGLAIDEFKALL